MEGGREREMVFGAMRVVPDTQRGGVLLGVDLGLVALGAELGVLGVELGDLVLGEGPDIPNTGEREWLWRKIKIKIDARYALRAPGRCAGCGVSGDGERDGREQMEHLAMAWYSRITAVRAEF